MYRLGLSVATIVAVAGLATGVLMFPSVPLAADTEIAIPGTASEHAAEAARYEEEARALEAKADRHASLARTYKARGNSTSKQSSSFRSLSKHCDRLAKAYRATAAEARDMAVSHRKMGSSD